MRHFCGVNSNDSNIMHLSSAFLLVPGALNNFLSREPTHGEANDKCVMGRISGHLVYSRQYGRSHIKGAFDWRDFGTRINRIASIFFFGAKCLTIYQRHFVGKRCYKSSLYTDDIKFS